MERGDEDTFARIEREDREFDERMEKLDAMYEYECNEDEKCDDDTIEYDSDNLSI